MELADIQAEIYQRRPEFKEMLSRNGDGTLIDYYAQDFEGLMDPSGTLSDIIAQETSLILGDTIGQHAKESIIAKRWINTADHHGLLHHPYFYSAALARSHKDVRKETQATVTLPFGGVSLSNDSYPRGFSFHDEHGELQKVFFKSLQERRLPVYALEPIQKSVLVAEKERCTSLPVKSVAKEKLMYFFEQALADERVWGQRTFSKQLTVLNALLWGQLFGDTRGDFVYLQIDDIANALLLEKHLVEETEIHQLLFTPSWRLAFIDLFSGIAGSHTETSGTHFFWYIDHLQKMRQAVRLFGDRLVTEDGSVTFELSPESIAMGIQKGQLMPSTALILLILHGSEKLACAGGPSQLQYLTRFMAQWHTLLGQFGFTSQTPVSTIWCADNTLFQVTLQQEATPKLATLFDVLLYSDSYADTIDTALEETTMQQTVDAMMPTLYSMYTKEPLTTNIFHTVPHIHL